MLRSKSFDLLSIRQEEEKQNDKTLPRLKVKGSYGPDSPSLALDRAIVTDPEDTKRRRTIKLTRDTVNRSWGFTLQTYGIRNKKTCEVEVMSYVDYVELHGPAWVAGMRRGDIILSVNGDSVEYSTHMQLVQRIKQCRREMRLVVLFENCCKKVELHERYLKLKKLLALKLKQLKSLEEEERLINEGVPLSQIDSLRRSTSSSISLGSEWDAYSEITSPSMLNGTTSHQFVFRNELDSDTSSGSIVLDTSFTSDKWQPNASAESVASSNPDSNVDSRPKSDESESDSRGFVQSSQSDFSEASENSEEALKHFYNIARCADHLTEACKCTNFVPSKARSRSIEEASKEGSSMSNLVDGSGVQLRAIKKPTKYPGGKNIRGLRTPSSASSSSSSPRDQVRMKKGSFYVESDSEESVISADTERSASLETSTSSNADSRISVFSKGQMTVSSSLPEKDEDESEDFCRDNSTSEGKENDSENQDSSNTSVLGEFSDNPIAESSLCSDTSMRSPDIKARADILQWEASGDSPTVSINQAALGNAHLSLSLSASCDDQPSSTNVDCAPSASPDLSSIQTRENKSFQNQPQVQIDTDSKSRQIKGHSSDIPRKEIDSLTASPDRSNSPQKSRQLEPKFQIQRRKANSNKPPANTSNAMMQEDTHSGNRLVDGILVNDQSQSTRL